MSTIQFLMDWTLRSSILIIGGGLLLRIFRVRDCSIRLAAWTAMLAGSLAMPLLGLALPKTILAMPRVRATYEAPPPVEVPAAAHQATASPVRTVDPAESAPLYVAPAREPESPVAKPFEWAGTFLPLYALICGVLLFRVCMGLLVGLRLRRASRATGQAIEGIEIRESDRVGTPVALGIARPAIMLPEDWREWDAVKLEAVLAHEISHIRRRDPALQLVSAMHRALLWVSPLSWLLHQRIVRAAEEVSDDAALAATSDRTSYAETLLHFMQRGRWRSGLAGVPMAHYGRPDERIHRILNGTALSHGLNRRSVAAMVALGSPLAYVIATAQARPEFEIADVRVSPRSDWVKKAANNFQGGFLNAGRYELRHATMLDLIRTAYGVDADKVYGGPSWLDYDRFDVIAKAPATTRPDAVKLMLQALLADRFKLVVKKDTRPVPGYVLKAGKGKPKLKPAEGSDSAGCRSLGLTIGADVPYRTLECRNVTLEAFAPALRGVAGSSFGNLPVADATGIEGAWDFDLKYPLQVISLSPGAPAAISNNGGIFEAVEKQLGLTLERGNIPQPVLSVESVNQQPAPNPPGVTAALPPLPPLEFEVASIKPCDGNGPNTAPRFESGGRVTAHCMYLGNLIRQLWGIAPFEDFVGAPKWLSDGSLPSFSIEAKAPSGRYVDEQGGPNRNALDEMMRALIVDRFKMAFHYEERPVDAYTLVAAKPKMTKADPLARTGCTRQNPPARGPGLSLRLVCQNITMAQFAEQIQGYDPDVFYPVLDGTGLDGAWDFTLNYNALINRPPPLLAGRGGGPTVGAAEASDPSGVLSFMDAVEKQLGLKLEKHKRPVRIMIIDHIEPKATEN